MLEHGSNNSLPAKHRIALALSTAFLIHTLVLSGFPAIAPELPVQHRQQLAVELVAPSQMPSAPARAARSTPKTEVHNPPFEVPPLVTSKPEQQPPILTTNRAQQKTVAREDTLTQAAANPKTAEQEPPPATPSPSAQPSKSTAEITKISRSPGEQDPYLIKLATHLAYKLETLSVPAIRNLTDTVNMELELQLLGNGALIRARVIESTGIELIDRAAYRAALSASPYPEPPPDKGGQNLFEVKLVFSPSRL